MNINWKNGCLIPIIPDGFSSAHSFSISSSSSSQSRSESAIGTSSMGKDGAKENPIPWLDATGLVENKVSKGIGKVDDLWEDLDAFSAGDTDAAFRFDVSPRVDAG